MTQRTKRAPDFPDTVRRLNYLIEHLGVKRYLEIGLGNGGTFETVEVADKVGVDPHPWNPALSRRDGVQLLTSDAYFSRNWNAGLTFDLILLDGLHTAEQTYRDFVNSLHYAHARTVWLIDDVMPNDAFSAIPDQAEAIRQRKAQTGSNDAAWHGDVFKALWMIKTFHNNMTMRTMWKAQPQALVYYSGARKSGARKTPVKRATLGEIARLTYDDTVSRRAEYNLGEESTILKECVAAVKKRTTASP